MGSITCTLDYAAMEADALLAGTNTALASESLATIAHFPSDAEALVAFARQLGAPMLRRGTAAAAASSFVGDVRWRPDIEAAQRLPTQTASELSFHTARSFEVVRPRYFAMLMVDPGWIDGRPGTNGESLLVRWRDVIAEYHERYPDTADQDLGVLRRTRIAYRPWYLRDEPSHEPLLRDEGVDGDVEMRYWEDLLATLPEALQTVTSGEDAEAFATVIGRFDAVLNSAHAVIEHQMQAGQLTLVDNRRVAHARRPFVPNRVRADGTVEHNPRRLLTVHIR